MQRLNGDTPWYLKDLIVEEEDHDEGCDEEGQIRNNYDSIGQTINGAKNIVHHNVHDYGNGAVHFTPFSGDEDDLMELLKNSPSREQEMDEDEYAEKWLSRSILVGIGGGGVCCFLLLIYVYKYRIISPSESTGSTGGQKCQQDEDCEKENAKDHDKITKAEESKETLATTVGVTSPIRDLKGFFQGNCYNDTNQAKNDREQEKTTESLQLLSEDTTMNRKRDLGSFFESDVPELAEVLSRSGLDKQESIKIVTKEVFETHRRNTEELRRQRNIKCCQLQEEAKKACNELMESIGATLSGAHFLSCIVLGCGVKILLSHRRSIFDYVMNEDQTLVFDLALQWISSNVCGCLEIDNADSFDPVKSTSSNSIVDGSWWLSTIIPHVSSFFSSIINISPFYGRCLFKIVGYTILLSTIHRLLQIFHCQSLHYGLNLIIFFSAMVKTAFGKSALALVLQILAFNVLECCVVFFFYVQRKEKLDILSLHHEEIEFEQSLTETIIGCRRMKWRLYATSTGSAMILGLVSYVSTV